MINLDRDKPADSTLRGRADTMPDTSFPTPPDCMTQTDFMACFGGIYEHSPWVAAALWDEGLGPEDKAGAFRRPHARRGRCRAA